MLDDIKSSFKFVFGGAGKHRSHHKRYTEFNKKWGFLSFVIEEAESFKAIEEIEKSNLMDFLFFLEYKFEKADVMEDEEKFQSDRRKAKRGK